MSPRSRFYCLEAALRNASRVAAPPRHMHKLTKLAGQPNGLQDLTDDELRIWLADRRAGLARVEDDNSGRSSKARRGWADAVAAAEAEIERRRF